MEPELKKKNKFLEIKKNIKKNLLPTLLIMIGLFGLTYAFFIYRGSGDNRELVAGQLYLNMDESDGFLTLQTLFPETKEQARARDDNTVTFTVTGRNESNQNIYYEINLNEGEELSGYERFNANDLVFDLVEIKSDGTEKYLANAASYDNLNKVRMWVDNVASNNTNFSKTYRLRMWLNENIVISDTENDADYTTEEFMKHYASIKVGVYGDFEHKEMPFLYNKIESTLTLTEPDSDGTRYVTGQVDNNYVWYSGKLWRIVALNEDGTVKLVTQNAMTAVAWNKTKTNTDYSNGQIRNWLKTEFLPTIQEDLIIESTWDDTTYSSLPTTKNEVTNPITDKVGLLTIYDYIMTGGYDFNSTSNTFLNNGYYWWTMSPQTSGSDVWLVYGDGYAYYINPLFSYGIRPSVNLISSIQLVDNEADGTKDKPYMLKGDYEVGQTNDNLNTRLSGEYIKFNNVLYRIVGTEEVNGNLLTKVTMADYSVNKNTLSTSVAFGASTSEITFSPNYGIGLYLENWYKANSTSTDYATTYINDSYKAMIATKDDGVEWYAGPSNGDGRDYTLAKTGTSISATIGLGRYGEMFSSQFGDSYSSSIDTWLMSKYSNSNVWYVMNYSTASSNSPTSSIGVRPSFYLKSLVKIGDVDGDGNSGNGQASSPYEIYIPENYFKGWTTQISNQKSNITEVNFVNMETSEMESRYNAATIKADLTDTTKTNPGLVYGWLEADTTDTSKYILYVASDGVTFFPTSSSQMFYNWTNLKNINFENIDTTKVTTMSMMFWNCSGLASLDVSGFVTSSVTTMYGMFYNCKGLTSLDVSSFVTTSVKDMSSMFQNCSSLTNLAVSGFVTTSVTNMSSMFSGCSGLTSLNVSGFVTSNVTQMYQMFYNCKGLTSLDVSGFVTSSVTNMRQMFGNCSGLTSLDVSRFVTSSVTNMSSMFQGCSSLTSLDVSGFVTSSVTNMSQMFYSCSKLTSLDVSGFVTTSVTDIYGMFGYCYDLTSLDVSGFVTTSVTNMSYMFSSCSKLTSLDVSGFVTTSVTNMASMFSGCSGLTSLNVSGFVTTGVTNMSSMFSGCSGLTSLNVSGFVTTGVTNMSSMFSGCSGLTSLDVSGFVTTGVTSMSGMFQSCSGLTSLDVSGFVTTSVTTMYGMFQNCSGLTSLDVSGFVTTSVTNMSCMFQNCKGLTILDLTNFVTTSVKTMTQMFTNCSSLITIYANTDWNTTTVTSSNSMFYGCSKLEGAIDYDQSKITVAYANPTTGYFTPTTA